jgi:hypothetical protein
MSAALCGRCGLDATDRVLRAIVKTFPSEAREQGARKP